jgi:ADP-heptose:LPS heptosyltransferase
MNILIVRLGALGDIVHAVPAAAAVRAAFPDARIDWLVEAKHRGMVDLVSVVDHVVTLDAATPAGWIDVVRRLRPVRYDVALDFQGLMKSAMLARASGARRVVGFSIWHLREKSARPFYSDVQSSSGASRPDSPRDFRPDPPGDFRPDPPGGFRLQAEDHVIRKNLNLLTTLGIDTDTVEFPLRQVPSPALDQVSREQGGRPFALINPGAAWPNKRWPPERFGDIAAFLREVRGVSSVVLWGKGEQPLAQAVVDASSGAARLAPPTTLVDLLELSRAASLMVSGDTGPLHIAAAASTPVVALFGPTDPLRNGPWSNEDEVVSRYARCGCHYQRRCHQPAWCLADVSVAEVTAAIQQRFSGLPRS